jgi:hypothetical protein
MKRIIFSFMAVIALSMSLQAQATLSWNQIGYLFKTETVRNSNWTYSTTCYYQHSYIGPGFGSSRYSTISIGGAVACPSTNVVSSF